MTGHEKKLVRNSTAEFLIFTSTAIELTRDLTIRNFRTV